MLVMAVSFLTGFSSALPEDGSCYMVSGIINADGTGYLERVELISDIPMIATSGGMKFAVLGCDASYSPVSSVPFGVDFDGIADGGGSLDSVPFTILVPYSDEITNFSLVNDADQELSWLQLTFDSITIDWFDVTQTEVGFELSWSVSSNYNYSCDVTAISVYTGERNIVAFRTTDTYLTISNDWLEPNELVYFELAIHDGTETAITTSGEYATADGVMAQLDDAEDYGSDFLYGNQEAASRSIVSGSNIIFLVLIIAGGLVVVGIIVAIVLIVALRGKHKRK
jgi:hypothetical protein